MRTAKRLDGIGVSPIRKVSEGAPPGSSPLGLGEPTWAMPEVARRALASFAAESNKPCGYGPQQGRLDLRRAIGEYSGGRGPDDVVVTNGAQEALYVLAQAFVGEGDAVLVPDPGFVGYEGVAKLAGATPVSYPVAAHDRFRLDVAAFASVLKRTPNARLAIVGHPANPTGGGATGQALAEVARICHENDVVLVSDEVYRELWYERAQPSLFDVAQTGFVVNSVSKGFGSPGLRIGWIVGQDAELDPVRVVHGYAVTSASMPSQVAACAMLAERESIFAASRAEVHRRFEALQSAYREFAGVAIEPPDGSFYHFHRLPEAAHEDPFAWCIALRDEAKVVLIPGLPFGEGGRGFARLSFAAEPEQVREGVRRLAEFEERRR